MPKKTIPKHAKKVFDGEFFRVMQWEQKMFDSTTRTFEAASHPDGVTVIATVKDKIVILKQRQPHTKWYYTLPGGIIDNADESPKHAALRELIEETGLKPKTIKYWQTFKRGWRVDANIHIFIAKDCKEVTGQSLDGGEEIQVELVSFEHFLKLSDESTFHNRDLIIEMLRARLHKDKKEAFKKLIFG
jgi:8-oxo-dGTP pyrophosphatase MutT (NUDIX family)